MSKWILLPMTLVGFLPAAPAIAEAQSAADVAVLRNTVINMLQALVQKGLITKEAAERLVSDAQAQAEAETRVRAAEQAPEPSDVRVTYVPETVREQIRTEVKAELEKEVTASVVSQARAEGWGVPAALPEWVRNARWSGDVRLRGVSVGYGSDNADLSYLDFQEINDAGGIGKAGTDAFLNATKDEQRFAARLRFGGEFSLAEESAAVFRLSTGNTDNPVSRDQSLTNYERNLDVVLDEVYLRFRTPTGQQAHYLNLLAGRIANPWQHTELVWDPDLRFNGVALQYAWREPGQGARGPFATLGAFPLEEIELSSDDKWLWAGQAGYEHAFTDTMKGSLAAAYYHYENISGRRNAPDSSLLDYTAPDWVQKGNTLFDIRNDTNPDTNLFALAADYQLLDLTGMFTLVFEPDFHVSFVGDYVKNLGYDKGEVQARTGVAVPEESSGYRFEVRAGAPELRARWDWRAFGGWTHLERDAVPDAFTDSDFHRGGTDAEGYFLGMDVGLTRNTWARLRYLSADEIDGPPLAIDILFLDLNTSF
jgi:polyhydroxyalkanoate synthesis regulator phasin